MSDSPIRILSGNPTDEDIAVLVTVLGSASGSDDGGAPRNDNQWGSPQSRLRNAWPAGPSSFLNARFG